jgi:glycerol uptake facilitator-like aquaporin
VPRSALQDNGNIGAGNLIPLGLFFVIFGIGACFGWETGYAINLARDFGPRLMSYCLGYGHHVWEAGGYYFWVLYISCPCAFKLTVVRFRWLLHFLDAPLEVGFTTSLSSRVSLCDGRDDFKLTKMTR